MNPLPSSAVREDVSTSCTEAHKLLKMDVSKAARCNRPASFKAAIRNGQRLFHYVSPAVYTCNGSTCEVKVGGSRVQGQPHLYSVLEARLDFRVRPCLQQSCDIDHFCVSLTAELGLDREHTQ